MTSGYELILRVRSRVPGVLLEIKEILTDVYLDLKPKILPRVKELELLARKSVKALKEKKLFQTLKRQK